VRPGVSWAGLVYRTC